MNAITTSARRLGLAALLAAALVPAANAAEVPVAADRSDRAAVPSDDQIVAVPVQADATDRIGTRVPVAADAADRVRTPVPVAADAPDRVPAVPAPAADDGGVPVAVPLVALGLLAAAGIGAVVVPTVAPPARRRCPRAPALTAVPGPPRRNAVRRGGPRPQSQIWNTISVSRTPTTAP